MSTLKAMIHTAKASLELYMMAATFAQADDRSSAMEFLQKRNRERNKRRVENHQRKEEQQRTEEQRRLQL